MRMYDLACLRLYDIQPSFIGAGNYVITQGRKDCYASRLLRVLGRLLLTKILSFCERSPRGRR